MSRYGIFDIIGPIMIGPSSSHTAGAVRIGLMAGQLTAYHPLEVRLQFHGSWRRFAIPISPTRAFSQA